ncbi:MAG TPA: flagellar type III secretion system pore protein FliP [Steroidobacteraceae bacterium]|nr:flagellar type III secretion system pore protein FliP [Steroidobacteraceae bacterium]
MRPPRLIAVLAGVLATQFAHAADSPLALTLDVSKAGNIAGPLKIVALMTVLALLPAVVIAMTSFTRTIIVLSMLRHAFGMQDTPPNMVLLSVALFLTVFTMAPAIEQINRDSIQPLMQEKIDAGAAVVRGVQPLRDFMVRQTREKDLALMIEIAHAPQPATIDDVKTIHIVPAFLLSELKTAFQIGFVVFLPFLLLDLVVASVLMSMGMLMVPPTIISLPLKVLMFVLIDGWSLVVRALLGSFH